MVWWSAAKRLLQTWLLTSCCLVTAQFMAQDGNLARVFCSSPAAKQLTCGWASNNELSSTFLGCAFCGTIWAGQPQPLPRALVQDTSYLQYYPQIISLGCPERVVVRTVFKVLSAAACSRLLTDQLGPLATTTSFITRCELELPPGNEVEASVKSREVNCKPCTTCADCALNEGQWYSDTFRTNFGGCKAVLNSASKYEPAIAAVLMNPGAKVLLTKFEVQED
ncbi:hypothetical protein V8C86DRAFT_2645264 [Haematococcus lacustris]